MNTDNWSEIEQMNERHARIVECRYFAGYNIEETAEILDISPATVKRDWTLARAWLFNQIHQIDNPKKK